MSNFKNILLKKKIDGVLYDLYVKTTIDQIIFDDTTTLAAKLTTMLTDISTAKTQLATLLGEGEADSITSQIESAVSALKDELTDDTDATSLAGKIKALNDAVDAINNVDTGILASAKAYTDAEIVSAKAAIKADLAGAFHFKGTVDYIEELPDPSAEVETDRPAEGDVYQVKYAGAKPVVGDGETAPTPTTLNAEFAFNGTDWIELGSIVDLSGYSTTTQVTSAIATAKSEAIAAASGELATAKTALEGSIATKARFILAEEAPEDLTEADIFAQIIPDPTPEPEPEPAGE